MATELEANLVSQWHKKERPKIKLKLREWRIHLHEPSILVTCGREDKTSSSHANKFLLSQQNYRFFTFAEKIRYVCFHYPIHFKTFLTKQSFALFCPEKLLYIAFESNRKRAGAPGYAWLRLAWLLLRVRGLARAFRVGPGVALVVGLGCVLPGGRGGGRGGGRLLRGGGADRASRRAGGPGRRGQMAEALAELARHAARRQAVHLRGREGRRWPVSDGVVQGVGQAASGKDALMRGQGGWSREEA